MYVPEEIIHAAGMLPITMLGGGDKITAADKYLQPYLSCGLMRSNLDTGLLGKFDFLDGVIIPDICEPTQMVADIWRLHVGHPFHHNLMIPLMTSSPRSRDYSIGEFNRLKTALGQFVGRAITDEALRRSIAIYNENRRLLSRLYDLRREPSFPLNASDVANIVLTSMLMPKEAHSQLLASLLSALDSHVALGNASSIAKIVLTGYTCDRPENDLLDFLESMSARIVDDDLYVGRRYFHALVSESVAPIEALADRYLAALPCVTRQGDTMWSDFIIKMASEAGADGVLVVPLKYCDPVGFEYPHLKAGLDQAGIPHLMMELDERGSGRGMARTRLQAFMELVSERKES
jgi:benzoyl-CoA reductase subunit C